MKELISVENLCKSFISPIGELKVLKGIDVTFYEGEVVSIVGVSGAGKSTFLHILGTLDRPTSGSIKYRTRDSADWLDPFRLNDNELALFRNKEIGFIFQFHYLMPDFTAYENIIMPALITKELNKDFSLKDVKNRAEELLNSLDIYDRKDHKPGELSGGEQQRVAVARALIQNPRVVLADEPTGNLDAASAEDLFNLLMKLNASSGITFIIVTHNNSLSERCHRIMRMTDGRIIQIT
ncbi:MAG: ABC transporter ATP-binding protein [Thermodesulfovibrionales bacterium]|nr:ABC transporter ATP-binding protein [Thermodesulfovibrionales bacterium]